MLCVGTFNRFQTNPGVGEDYVSECVYDDVSFYNVTSSHSLTLLSTARGMSVQREQNEDCAATQSFSSAQTR